MECNIWYSEFKPFMHTDRVGEILQRKTFKKTTKQASYKTSLMTFTLMHIFPTNFPVLSLRSESAAKYFLKYQKHHMDKPTKVFPHIAKQSVFQSSLRWLVLDTAEVLTVQQSGSNINLVVHYCC